MRSSDRFLPASRNRLTRHDLGRFPGDRLFDRLGRAVCLAHCLPRKELYESWEVAKRARRLLRGGRIVDLGGGHGLLAHAMILLDDSSPSACVVDPIIPASASVLHAAIVGAWPRLADRIAFVTASIDDVVLTDNDVIVSSHACGALTDRILTRAVAAGARLAVLPCCHDIQTCDPGPLAGWMDVSLAIDAVRAQRLAQHGYRVRTQTIPREITPKNRLLLATPRGQISIF
jgi:hypothetical protein